MSVYAYSDLNRVTRYLDDTDLTWRDTWAAGVSYSPPDAVYHGGGMWLSLAASTNVSPLAIMRSRVWSQLVLYKESPVPPAVPGLDQVLQIAVAGTNLALLALDWLGTLASAPATTGTLPTSLAVDGTLYFDFAGSKYQEATVDQNVWISAKNPAAGREITVVLAPDSADTDHWLGYAPFKWFGTAPPGTLSDKEVMLQLTAFDGNLAAVRAAPLIQL